MSTYYPNEKDLEWAENLVDNLNYWKAQREMEAELNGE